MSTSAQGDFEELLANLPATADVLALRTAALAQEGEELQAESILRLAISKHATTSLRETLGRVLIRQNRHKEAMSEMVLVLREEPESPGALMVLAICLVECGELDRGGKMLQKAALAGAAVGEVKELEGHWRELVIQSGGTPDMTMPEFPNPMLGTTRPESAAEEAHRKRNETLMGRPNTGRIEDPPIFSDPTAQMPAESAAPPTPQEPRRLPPSPLESGSFANLSTYDIEGADEDELDTTATAAEKLRLSDRGPLERVPAPVDESNEYADPDDKTMALSIDEADIASPMDATAHIPYDDVEQGLRGKGAHIVSQEQYAAPNVASDPFENHFDSQPNQVAHRPPADLDDLPSWDATMSQPATAPPAGPTPGWGNEMPVYSSDMGSGPQPGFQPPPQAHQPGESQLTERPVAQSRLDYGDWNDIPAGPQAAPQYQSQPNQQNPFGSSPAVPPVAAPYQPDFPMPHAVPTNEPWTPPQQQQQPQQPQQPVRREITAVAGREAPKSGGLLEKRWPIVVVVFLAVVIFSFVGVTIAAGASLASDLESAIQASLDAQATDTFQGYVDSEAKLNEAAALASFMGPGFDRFVESTVPLPGLSGAELRRRAITELASVSALLEYRFEKIGSRDAEKRVDAAKEVDPEAPDVVVGQAYLALAANRPADAVQILEAAQAKQADPALTETLTWALLALDRIPAATEAAQPLRDEETQSVQQQFLLASLDAARGDANASKAFADVFAASPDHIDSRIARSYTLRGDPKQLEDAQKVLQTALELSEKTTAYQKARAIAAFGAIYLAKGEKKAAEERFRSAVAKAPTRGDLYVPLLHFVADEGNLEEVQATLEKAKSNDAYSLPIAFFDAERQLLASNPEATAAILDKLNFEDAHKAFLKGLALIVQSNSKGAVEVLEAGQNAPGNTTEAQALLHLAKAMSYTTEAAQDAVYQLDSMKSKHADNAVVHWAAAAAASIHAELTTSKKTRGELLKAATADIERAVELRPSWAPIHFARCEIRAKVQEVKQAEKACEAGAKLAPAYAPGIVVWARLRLQEGKFDEAKKLSDQAMKLRPNDPVVGLLAARVAIERLQLEDAAKLINRWLGKNVDKYELSLLEGRREFAREDYTRAAGYLKEAFELRPADGEAALYYAQTLARLGDTKNADKIILGKTKGGISYLSHPTWSGYAWAVLGEVRRKQRRVRDALTNLKKAEGIYKKQVVPDRYYSHLYTEFALTYRAKYRKWRHPLVNKMLVRGRKKGDKMDPGLNMAFGRMYLERRRPNYDAAMRYIKKVVEVAPYKCDAVEALRTLYAKAKQDQKDVDALEEIYTANCAPKEEQK